MGYDTVKDLRQARSQRLGAMQRKLPAVHFVLLYVLGLLELFAFPFLGAGTASMYKEYTVLNIQSLLFGAMCGAIVMTLQVCYELWQPFGGAYTVDSVMNRMVRGLEEELEIRREMTSVVSLQKPKLADVGDMMPMWPQDLQRRWKRKDEGDEIEVDWTVPTQLGRWRSVRRFWRRVRSIFTRSDSSGSSLKQLEAAEASQKVRRMDSIVL